MRFFQNANNGLTYIIIVGLDYIFFLIAIIVTLYAREAIGDLLNRHEFWINNVYIYIILPIIYLFFHQVHGVYKWQIPFWKKAGQVLVANTYYLGTILLLLYMAHIIGETSRLFFILFVVFLFIFSLIGAYFTRIIVRNIDALREPAIIMGRCDSVAVLEDIYKSSHSHRIKIMGYVQLPMKESPHVNQICKCLDMPCLGTLDNIESIINKLKIRNVIIALPDEEYAFMQQLVHRMQPLVEYVYFASSVSKLAVTNLEINLLENGNIAIFSIKNNMCVKTNRIIKRIFDFLSAVLGGICILPILIGISLWIYIDSPGPVLFKQKRIGRNGQLFSCYKFRSMCVDADKKLKELLHTNEIARAEWANTQKLKNDPRVTRSGTFLRATSLDELPQLWNVIRGDMSLVGPRPIVTAEIEKYGDYIDDYYLTRPGMTGLWQTSGRSDVTYEGRVEMDTWYVRNWSLWLDCVLLFRTIKTVLLRKGAY